MEQLYTHFINPITAQVHAEFLAPGEGLLSLKALPGMLSEQFSSSPFPKAARTNPTVRAEGSQIMPGNNSLLKPVVGGFPQILSPAWAVSCSGVVKEWQVVIKEESEIGTTYL